MENVRYYPRNNNRDGNNYYTERSAGADDYYTKRTVEITIRNQGNQIIKSVVSKTDILIYDEPNEIQLKVYKSTTYIETMSGHSIEYQ